MESQDLPAKDAPLIVNEQVIVMSGHETIRVLEVEVDASAPSDEKNDIRDEERGTPAAEQREAGRMQDAPHGAGGVGLGEQRLLSVDATPSALQTLAQAVPISVSLAQPQATMPITMQGCPQVLTQESLATLMTGMMAQAGSLGQPLLIPLNMAGSLGGQGGLAVLTLPTTNLATLSGLAAANPAGNLLKLPLAGVQAATVLNSVQSQLQTTAAAVFQPQAASVQPLQQPTQVTSAQAQVTLAPATCVSQPSFSMSALQTAGLSINPAIVRTRL